MLIILEGCDKCGKTTLAKKIRDRFDAEYVKFSQPKKPPYLEYCEFTQSVKEGKDYVLDRFCYGEMVYGPIYRGSAGMNYDDMWKIEHTLEHLGAIVIWCNTHAEEIAENFTKDNEEFAKFEDISKIIRGYHNLWTQKTILKPYIFNYLVDPDHVAVMSYLEGQMS